MKKGTYIALIIFFSLFVGFLLLLVSGGYIFEGEAAMGVGLLWYYSLPAFLLFGYLAGQASYSWYSNQRVVLIQSVGLLGFSLVVSVLAPAMTYGALYMRSLW